jgi:hypothetical protein
VKLILGAAVLGVAAMVAGIFVDARQAVFSYLTAYLYWLTLGLGGLILLMCGHATHARWFVLVRRVTEILCSATPIFAVLFIPILFGLDELYPWVNPGGQAPEIAEAVAKKAGYLNVPFFLVRTAFYFLVFVGVGELLLAWSRRQDREPNDQSSLDLTLRQRALSAGGFVPLAIALTFSAFDWIMSLEPAWYSTIYPLYIFTGAFVSALAAQVVLTYLLERSGLMPEPIPAPHYQALGKLLLAFVIFWGYIGYCQYFVIWMADLPEEVTWYKVRLGGSWEGVAAFLIVAHFVIPLVLLLSRRLKRNPVALCAVSIWILIAHYVDLYWLVIPALHPEGLSAHWLDLGAFLLVGGVSLAFGVWRLQGKALVPRNDPYYPASLRYHDT